VNGVEKEPLDAYSALKIPPSPPLIKGGKVPLGKRGIEGELKIIFVF
jgi:hypothetical protein